MLMPAFVRPKGRRTASTRAWLAVTALIIGLSAVACGGSTETSNEPAAEDLGVERAFEVPSGKHVTGRVTYAQTPPVGGDHFREVERCGFYAKPVTAERGVHSLEHGAVWITYRRSLPKEDVDALQAMSRQQSRLLVSRWDSDLPAPIVASAWGHQLKVASASDPRLAEFVTTYVPGKQAPEPGAFC